MNAMWRVRVIVIPVVHYTYIADTLYNDGLSVRLLNIEGFCIVDRYR